MTSARIIIKDHISTMANEEGRSLETTQLLRDEATKKNNKVTLESAAWKIILVAIVAAAATFIARIGRGPGSKQQQQQQQQQLQLSNASPFPPDFLWGAATSAYQIEGGATEGMMRVSSCNTYIQSR